MIKPNSRRADPPKPQPTRSATPAPPPRRYLPVVTRDGFEPSNAQLMQAYRRKQNAYAQQTILDTLARARRELEQALRRSVR